MRTEPMGGRPGAGTRAMMRRMSSQRPGRLLTAVVLLFAIGFSLTGCFFFEHERRTSMEGAREQLEAIADLKINQLSSWWEERQQDAALVFSPFLANRIQTFLDNPAALREGFRLRVLDQLQQGRYERILLLDPQMKVRYSTPSSEAPLDPTACALVRDALRTGQILTSPLHRVSQPAGIYMDIAIPRFAEASLPAQQAGGPFSTNRASPPPLIGVVLFRVNAAALLFPRIQSWPYPSRSAETQVVRREGETVVYLTDLRFHAKSTFPFSRSVREPDLVAAMAARGQKGTLSGRDYRGVRVMATVRPIPGLGCLLITKIDQAEFYQPLRNSILCFALVQGMLVLSATLGVGFIWRDRENRFARKELEVQKQTTEALRQSAERLRTFTAATFEGIAVSEAGRVLDVNDQYLRLLGARREEVVGRSILEFIGPEARPAVETAIRIDSEASYESKALTKDGRLLDVEVRPRMLLWNGRKIRISAVRDITERRQAEAAQGRMELQLRQAQKMEAIGNLAAGIAHEINTPAQFTEHNLLFLQEASSALLRTLQGLERLLPALPAGRLPPELTAELAQLTSGGNLDMMAREIPAAIQDSLRGTERIRKIVLAMREFSYSGKGCFDRPEPTDLKRALENTITVAKNEWRYVAELVTDFAPGLPLVPVFPGEFNQVVLNLLVNAAQAIGEAQQAEPARKGLITISTRLDGEWAEVRVRDNGVGIPENIRHRVFDLFFTTKEVGKGSGQGLALAHTIIVEKHHGSLSFESKVGQGTCFIVRVPLAPARPCREQNNRQA